MADLTAEEVERLPIIRARTYVANLRAVHVHQSLPGQPATVETESGQFRLSRKMSALAAKAYAAYADNRHAGVERGKLGTILASLTGAELSPSEVAEDEEEAAEAADPLHALASDLARQAMGKLEELLQKSVAREYERRRDALVADAIRSLV